MRAPSQGSASAQGTAARSSRCAQRTTPSLCRTRGPGRSPPGARRASAGAWSRPTRTGGGSRWAAEGGGSCCTTPARWRPRRRAWRRRATPLSATSASSHAGARLPSRQGRRRTPAGRGARRRPRLPVPPRGGGRRVRRRPRRGRPSPPRRRPSGGSPPSGRGCPSPRCRAPTRTRAPAISCPPGARAGCPRLRLAARARQPPGRPRASTMPPPPRGSPLTLRPLLAGLRNQITTATTPSRVAVPPDRCLPPACRRRLRRRSFSRAKALRGRLRPRNWSPWRAATARLRQGRRTMRPRRGLRQAILPRHAEARRRSHRRPP
mmetsp:Transcript_40411/g.96029  ORF Transcript_40411/g.96029 Transcript_40411/m.96029 type:complete len:321 (+) Transcript_40411:1365-2327(+)